MAWKSRWAPTCLVLAALVGSAARAQQPPRGIYLPVPPHLLAPRPPSPHPPYVPGGPPVPIFLKRQGGTYSAGPNDSGANTTSILSGGSATFPSFAYGDAVWNQMVGCVQQQFSRFNVEVTDQEPSRAHVEAVVSGTPDLLGLPSGVGGVAPIDAYSCTVVDSAVVFIFADVLGPSAQLLCQVVAQEVAHSFSLDHELLCSDPMTYLSGCGNKTFQDVEADCGEYSARACICQRPTQNSVRIMLEQLGPAGGSTSSSGGPVDTTPPQVTLTQPANNATLPANSTITVSAQASDNVGLSSVELLWAFTGNTFACPSSTASASCSVSGGTYTWRINVGTGARTFRVRARDAAGNQALTDNVSITLTEGGMPATPDTTAPTVSLVTPANGAILQANSQLTVSALAQDNVAVTSVTLFWDHNATTIGCPSTRSDAPCTVNGNSYTWTLNVGTGPRTFHVRAVDAAGNTADTPNVTVTLSDTPPAGDTTPPQVTLERPANGAQVGAGTPVEVAVTASDNVGVTAAELWWGNGGDRYPCPYSAAGVTCSVAGQQFLWRITAPAGSYPLEVHVHDGAGNQAQTSAITVTVGSGGTPVGGDTAEPNNDLASATRVSCGQSVDDVARDVDHFVVQVSDGDSLTATATSDAVTVEWLLRNGAPVGRTTVDGTSTVATAAGAPAGDMVVRVRPLGGAVNYTLTISCQPAAVGSATLPFGCTHSSLPRGPPWLWLGLVFLWRYRRGDGPCTVRQGSHPGHP